MGPVDDILGMFDTHTDGKRLLFQGNALVMEHVIRIAGTVADTHNDQLCRVLIAAVDGHRRDASAIVAMDCRDTAGKTDFAALRLDGVAHILDDAAQDIGPDVGIIGIQDVFRRSGIDESLQNAPQQRMIDAGRQFPIGKGPRSAFAELDVRRCLEGAAAPKIFNVFRAGIDVTPPFKDDRRIAVFSQGQGCRQAGRAGPDDDGPVGKRLRTGPDIRRRRLSQLADILIVTTALPNAAFVDEFHIDRKNEINPRFPPGVDGPADNDKAGNIAAAAAELLGD